jgi:hypothetical protein
VPKVTVVGEGVEDCKRVVLLVSLDEDVVVPFVDLVVLLVSIEEDVVVPLLI